MNCPECGHEMIPCPESYSKYSKGYIKTGELICELHGTLEMINRHQKIKKGYNT